MNAIADKYADQDVGSIFLYTHEAHPGENYPHHTSFEQKLSQAKDLQTVYGVTRTIVADSLDGACHRRFGTMPNMTWIVNKAGTPLYKSDWTDSESVENALIYFLNVEERRRGRHRLAPFRVERLDYREQNREGFDKGLLKSGPKALREFNEAFE